MTTLQILRAPPAPRGFLAGPLILGALFGLVALVPAPAPIRLAASLLAMVTLWTGVFFALPPPRLVLDDEGFTLRRRLGRARRVAWSQVEAFEIGRTPSPRAFWRVAAFVPLLILTAVAGGGYVDGDITDTSRAAIGWRRPGADKPRREDWIIDAYGLSQAALLDLLNARLAAARALSLEP